MAIFTLIFDWQGGTYVSQRRAMSPAGALRAWAAALDSESVKGLTARRRSLIVKASRETGNAPAPLGGLASAWCWSILLSGELGLLNIVQTAAVAKRRPNKKLQRTRPG